MSGGVKIKQVFVGVSIIIRRTLLSARGRKGPGDNLGDLTRCYLGVNTPQMNIHIVCVCVCVLCVACVCLSADAWLLPDDTKAKVTIINP